MIRNVEGTVASDMTIFLRGPLSSAKGSRPNVTVKVSCTPANGNYLEMDLGNCLTVYPDRLAAQDIIDELTKGLRELDAIEAAAEAERKEEDTEHGVPDSEREPFGCDTTREYEELKS